MEYLGDIFHDFKAVVPTILAVAGIIVFILIARYLIKKQSTRVASYRFRRQFLTFLLSLVGVLIIILVLPIGDTLRGQLLSLFGILLTASIALSATTFVGNIMAGLMLRAVGGFKPGDFVSVSEHFGRVTETGLFHVEIQTEFRDLTTIPNIYLVSHPVKVLRSSGTIITAEVSLGYDIPREKIQALLVKAAEEAELKDPFAHVVELGDFSVTYRIAGLLEEVKHILTARSQLRELMLDHLHRNGIEIVSPTFMNTRAIAPDRKFIPKPEKVPKAAPKKSFKLPERLVFDKADSAESLQKLKDHYKEYKKELDDIGEQIKEKVYSEDDPDIKQYKSDIENYLEKLAEQIKAAEESNRNSD